jgi:hypothetical protein
MTQVMPLGHKLFQKRFIEIGPWCLTRMTALTKAQLVDPFIQSSQINSETNGTNGHW